MLIHKILLKKGNLAILKSDVSKLDIEKVDHLDADNFKTIPIDIEKLNDVSDKGVPKNEDIIQIYKI